MNTTLREKTLKELVLGKCWNYINDNFHKFTEPNKIKIALALLQKSMPTIVEGDVANGPTQIVVVRSKEEEKKQDEAGTTQAVPRSLPIQQ